MNQKLKFLIIFVVIIVLSYLFSSYAGGLYEDVISRNVSAGWIGGCGECFEGFVLIFAFLSGLLLFGLFDKNRWKIVLPLVLVFPVILLLARIGEASLLSLATGIVGMLLGQLIYMIRRKNIKK
jgi:hypothetical protein